MTKDFAQYARPREIQLIVEVTWTGSDNEATPRGGLIVEVSLGGELAGY